MATDCVRVLYAAHIYMVEVSDTCVSGSQQHGRGGLCCMTSVPRADPGSLLFYPTQWNFTCRSPCTIDGEWPRVVVRKIFRILRLRID